MPNSYKTQLSELLNSAQQNLRENRDEFARADFLQALKIADQHFGPHSQEADQALRPLMELHFKTDEIDAGFQCLEKIDHNHALRKNQTSQRIYLFNDVAVIFGNKRNTFEAHKLLMRALTLSETSDKAHAKARVHTLINLGYYNFREQEYQTCVQFIEKALQEGKSVKPYPAVEYAKAAIILARAQYALVRSGSNTTIKTTDIASLLEHALRVISSLSQTPTEGIGMGYCALGIIYFQEGRNHEARHAFDKAGNAFEYCKPSAKQHLADTYVWSSDNEIKLDNHKRAESLLRKSLKLYEDVNPEHDSDIVNAKLRLTDFLIPRGFYVESATLLEEVIASIEASKGRDEPQLQRHCNNLGYVYVHLERFPLAEGILRRAQKFALKKSPPTPCAFITKNLGLMYQKMGHNDKAIIEYKKARKLFIEQYSGDHPMISFIDNALIECSENP